MLEEFLLSHLASKDAESASQSTLLLRAQDNTAAGSSTEFLNSKLVYRKDKDGQEICVVKSGNEEVGVMMGWERDISERFVKNANQLLLYHRKVQETVKQLYEGIEEDYSVLNVGFGLGIVSNPNY